MTAMKHILTILTLCVCSVYGMKAQGLKQLGTAVDDIVPEGWTHSEAVGDVDKDGLNDLVIAATPNFKENMKTRYDGYVYNFNKPILAIYLKSSDGKYRLYKKFENVIPGNENEFHSVSHSLEITNRGTVRITIEHFSSGGGYGSETTTYTFRMQEGEFYLIGRDITTLQRNTGESETISENYLTCKRQTVRDNAFENRKKSEKWTKLPKAPLTKLGDTMLE